MEQLTIKVMVVDSSGDFVSPRGQTDSVALDGSFEWCLTDINETSISLYDMRTLIYADRDGSIKRLLISDAMSEQSELDELDNITKLVISGLRGSLGSHSSDNRNDKSYYFTFKNH